MNSEAREARYILAHDMGTSSDKAVLVDYSGNICATAVEAYPTFIRIPHGLSKIPRITGMR